ncbi:hypothetical protein [Thermococcus thermotolerans]|uniref:hypothetical protein n=1 Tax=Thermococcus thermotolerans TaxID=2969672 RepID=UPI0021572DCB|nr:hypothetical protein [Thermococcus thermotolerans]
MTGASTHNKVGIDGFEVGGLYECPLDEGDFEVIVKDRTVLKLHNKLINQFDNIKLYFIIPSWNDEVFLELEKEVVHRGNDDLIEFDSDFTQAIFKEYHVKSIWFKQEFNKLTLYIFLSKINNSVHLGVLFFDTP